MYYLLTFAPAVEGEVGGSDGGLTSARREGEQVGCLVCSEGGGHACVMDSAAVVTLPHLDETTAVSACFKRYHL